MQDSDVTLIHETVNTTEPPLTLRNVHIVYKTRKGNVQAVRGIDLDLRPGESLALIGESGSGKTTLVLGLSIVMSQVPRSGYDASQSK